MVPARLSVLTLGARDVRALRSFYESLGWESTSPGGDEFAAFPLGGAVLGLYRMDVLARDAGLDAPPADAGFNGVTPAVNVDAPEQVDESLAAFAENGGRIVAEAETKDWGGRSGYAADPEGNVWEVAHLPGAEFDQRGALIWPY